MTFKHCVCADDEVVIVDTRNFRNEPVLWRMLGGDEDFAEPETDEYGRLLFLKRFGIQRSDFLECIVFLRSGCTKNMKVLFNVFAVFGGCERLDDAYRKMQAMLDMEKTKKLDNPVHPSEDYLHLYKFELHTHDWTHTGEWEVSANHNSILVWWRKRNV